jgi:hypothetical protein
MHVISRAPFQKIDTGAAKEMILTESSKGSVDQIVARSEPDPIVTVPALDEIFTAPPTRLVVSIAEDEPVGPSAAADEVVPATGEDPIVARRRDNDVTSCGATENIGPRRSHDRSLVPHTRSRRQRSGRADAHESEDDREKRQDFHQAGLTSHPTG